MTNPEKIFGRKWFYPFVLPDGSVTPTHEGGKLNAIHATRLSMIERVLKKEFGDSLQGQRVIDIACHQGFFASKLASMGAEEVIAIDARTSHVEDVGLIAKAMGLTKIRASQGDVHDLDTESLGVFDIVLMLGLIYHLENPVGAIRKAHALTNRLCLIETQVVPHLSGPVDWGHHTFVKELKGCFGVIDETEETHGLEASTLGICLAPSVPVLMWIMRKVGFDRVDLLEPPENAYEQHRFGKRVMVAGWRDR